MTYYTYKFEWSGNPGDKVQVTGNFDNWSKSHPSLIYDASSGKFTGLIKLKERDDLIFKFIVNDDWCVSEDYQANTDEHGNVNNFIKGEDLTIFEEFDQDPPITGHAANAKASENIDKAPVATEKESITIEKPSEIESPTSEKHGEKDGIQQVLTNSSSFAAVSLPSDASHFEEVEHEEPLKSVESVDAVKPIESTVTETQDQAPNVDKDKGETEKPISDSNSTLNIPTNYNYPGSYPISPKSDKPKAKLEKKDSLITRFKGLFRY